MRLIIMAIRSRGIIVAAVLVTALGLAALTGCGAGLVTGDDAGPAASTPATSGSVPSTGAVAQSSPAPAPGAGKGTPTPATGSGITGVTVVDGGCPVVRADSPCPDRPFEARLTVTEAASGTVVTTVDTDPAGHFRIPLRPGRYVVRAANPNGAPLPRAAAVATNVEGGRYTTMTIRFDSGIR